MCASGVSGLYLIITTCLSIGDSQQKVRLVSLLEERYDYNCLLFGVLRRKDSIRNQRFGLIKRLLGVAGRALVVAHEFVHLRFGYHLADVFKLTVAPIIN